MGRHAIAVAPRIASTAVRYCGVDISARPANQQLVTLHERRGPAPNQPELVATFYEPGTVADVAQTILGFGGEAVVAIDAPSGPRLDMLAAGSPLRATLELPDGRYETMRVCDALLFRRRLPLYPVPAADSALTRWQGWMQQGFDLFAALEALQRFTPDASQGHRLEGPVGDGALRFGRVAETYPDAVFCALLGHRPPAKRTPSGLQERIAALKLRGVVDEDGGLWRRTIDELDATAAAYAAYTLAAGTGGWVGDPREGVIVVPVAALAERYDKLPPPRRARLISASRRPPSST
jgi:predicted nuclease with RNAse H fold